MNRDEIIIDFRIEKGELKTSKKIDWVFYLDDNIIPFVLWNFWFYFWNIFIEIIHFKNSLMHWHQGTGFARISPYRALINFLIPSILWDYVKNKKRDKKSWKN